MTGQGTIAAVAAEHGLSEGAVRALDEALAQGGGRAAQWSHPDLGGMGQWFAGGMLQIGDMFNHDLKARVGAALDALSARPRPERLPGADAASQDGSGWWPRGLGRPAQVGGQNAMRYAVFPEARRLVVDHGGAVTVYDTGDHRLTGAAQAQGDGQTLAFSGSGGRIDLRNLRVVG